MIDGLVDEGTLEVVALPPEPVARQPDPDYRTPEFTGPQRMAADILRGAVQQGGFAVDLLDGVTGSGKTEVYFEAIAETIRKGRQALVLMPEIALTGQFLDRFAQRFGVRPAEWHSELSPRKRARTFAAVAAGEVNVVVGARSALFLPYADLGLIVVDEEHDAVYKQEDGVHYHARDMAVVRARIADIPIVLASATPSVETVVNARRGRYRRLALAQRFGGQREPAIEAIDLKREGPPRGRFIAPKLAGVVKTALERGEQALFFFNRRGYAPLTLCRACGFRLNCPNCDAWLVDHRFKRQLVCHHCGFTTPPPAACPKCKATESFVACGPGVERLEEEVAALFPEQRVLVLSSDLVASIERMREEFRDIEEGRVDIVIGTQLVAKGHHFPKLNLVGVVDADLGLGSGDPRAAERTFQLLHQVIGRAGPRGRPRRRLSADASARASRDAGAGRAGPRGLLQFRDRGARAHRLSAVRPAREPARHRRRQARDGRLRAQARGVRAARAKSVRVLGPAEAPLALIRGRHRFRLMVKSARNFDLSGYLRDWLAAAPKRKGDIKLDVDVDPQSFLTLLRFMSARRTIQHTAILPPRLVPAFAGRRKLPPRQQHAHRRREDQHIADDIRHGRNLAEQHRGRHHADHRRAQHAERGRHRRHPPDDPEPQEIGEARAHQPGEHRRQQGRRARLASDAACLRRTAGRP